MISLSQTISQAKAKNIFLGQGDPEEHLFYLGKLGLLPRAVKKKINGKIQGHYSEDVLDKLATISKLKNKGLAYSQMQLILTNSPSQSATLNPKSSKNNTQRFSFNTWNQAITSSPTAFLIIGLVLGFLITNQKSQPANSPLATANAESVAAQSSPLSSEEQSLVKLIQTTDSGQKQSIYVISEPKNSLTNLGTTKINLQ